MPIPADDRRRLAAFAPAFERLCADLAAEGTGDTVQHDDLHHHNVFRGPHGTRVLDWGDTWIAHPFFSAVVTFRFLEEHNGFAPTDPWFARVRDAYLEPFGRGHVEEFDLAQRVGIFAHAIAWGRCRAGLSPASRPTSTTTTPSSSGARSRASSGRRPAPRWTGRRRNGRTAAGRDPG